MSTRARMSTHVGCRLLWPCRRHHVQPLRLVTGMWTASAMLLMLLMLAQERLHNSQCLQHSTSSSLDSGSRVCTASHQHRQWNDGTRSVIAAV